MSRRHAPLTAFIAAVAGIAFFSVMDMVMKGLTLAIGAFATMLWRSLIGILLAGALFAWHRPAWPDRATLRLHVRRGVVTTAMAFLFFWGLARVPMAQAVALTFIAPLLALFLAAALLHEPIGRRTFGGSLAAGAGVVVIFIGQARADLGREALLGSAAILVSASIYAYNIVLMRQQALAARPVEIAFFQNMTVAAVLLLAVPFAGLPPLPDSQWPMLLLAGVLAMMSMLLLAWAYARAGAAYLSTTEYSSFLWAIVLGWLAFGERVSSFTMGGAALIVAGCVLAARAHGPEHVALEAEA
jgi:S-adenosylmethionine uptake transporter